MTSDGEKANKMAAIMRAFLIFKNYTANKMAVVGFGEYHELIITLKIQYYDKSIYEQNPN